MFGIKRLRRENAALREALDWYATSANWRRVAVHAKGEPMKWVKALTSFDRGARAKFVLSQLDALREAPAVAIPAFPASSRFPAAVDTSDTE